MGTLVGSYCALGQFLKVRLLDDTLVGSGDLITLPSSEFLIGRFGSEAAGKIVEAIAPLRPAFGEESIAVMNVCRRGGDDKDGFVMVRDLVGNPRRVHASCFISAR